MKTLKDTIKESGRFEAVMNNVLMLSLKDSSIPLHRIQIGDNNQIITRVEPDDVRKGIGIWEKYLDTTGENINDYEAKKMLEFLYVVESEVEMRLHNYSVSISHRKSPEERDIESIREWLVLQYSIEHMVHRYYDDDDNFIEFSIPNGWKAA